MTDFLTGQQQGLRTLLAKPAVQAYLSEHDGPVLFLEPNKVAHAYTRFQRALPQVHSHYALKANAHPAIIRTIKDLNGYFDAATNGEIDLLHAAGVDPSRVIHTHPYKKPADIAYAYKYGIRIFVVDSMTEVHKFRDYPDVSVLIRLGYSNPYAHVDLSSKFGVSHAEAEALLAAAHDLGITVAGFSYHPGSHLTDVETFLSTAKQTVTFVQRLQATGEQFRILDIGGGIPAPYTGHVLQVEEIAAAILPVLQPLIDDGMQILAEPGRGVVAEAVTLVCTVIGIRHGVNGTWYMLDDGLYGSYSNILAEQIHPLVIAEKQLYESDAPLAPATLGGPTCDSVDVVAVNLPLPDLRVGDRLLSPTMGAYTSVTATEFNGIQKTPIVVVD